MSGRVKRRARVQQTKARKRNGWRHLRGEWCKPVGRWTVPVVSGGFSAEAMALAQQVVDQRPLRAKENVRAWADRLVADVANAND